MIHIAQAEPQQSREVNIHCDTLKLLSPANAKNLLPKVRFTLVTGSPNSLPMAAG